MNNDAINQLTHTERSVAQAMRYPETQFFMTTMLFWDCECREDYIHPRDMLMCEKCGYFKDECPDSRINEIRAAGIHLPWAAPEFAYSLDAHNCYALPKTETPSVPA